MADDLDFRENVVVVNFPDESNAYEALTSVKELDSQGQLGVRAAAVVARHEDGSVVVKDEIGDSGLEGTATGGVLGLLIGILGGPLGVLIGGATGLLIGSLFDLEDSDQSESVLSDISQAIHAGHTALLAEVREQSHEVLDSAMSRVGGEVLRRSVADVEAEISAAEQAQRAAKEQARKELREHRQAEHKAQVNAKVEELKAKLHTRHTASTPSA
ncbi:MAG: DUF1269 domain-containing protein [Actinobacteria bacterium]|nr:MAG: DUF1269 domain-containing protein [Actinomycetota bacterium]